METIADDTQFNIRIAPVVFTAEIACPELDSRAPECSIMPL